MEVDAEDSSSLAPPAERLPLRLVRRRLLLRLLSLLCVERCAKRFDVDEATHTREVVDEVCEVEQAAADEPSAVACGAGEDASKDRDDRGVAAVVVVTVIVVVVVVVVVSVAVVVVRLLESFVPITPPSVSHEGTA